ncbi:MAG: conjugal transfer protein TraX [Defluviitaleaceae bacterium]|nr:conjugal transfer protein TraX [Defluviitaleaceae bacterium]
MPKLNAFHLKVIAIIGMVLNHAVVGLHEIIPVWLAVPMFTTGGLTFPIMGFLAVEGYKHTSNLTRYILRILVFGIIAMPFHFLTLRMPMFNIMFTIIVGLLALVMYDKIKSRVVFWILFVLLVLFTAMFDWGFIGVVMMLLYYIIPKEETRRTLPGIIGGVYAFVGGLIGISFVFLMMFLVDIMPELGDAGVLFDDSSMGLMIGSLTFGIGCIVAALLIKGYTGERGPSMKWAFYIAYPLHLAIIGLTAMALGLFSFRIFFDSIIEAFLEGFHAAL